MFAVSASVVLSESEKVEYRGMHYQNQQTTEVFDRQLARVIDSNVGGVAPAILLSPLELERINGFAGHRSRQTAASLKKNKTPMRDFSTSVAGQVVNRFDSFDSMPVGGLHVTIDIVEGRKVVTSLPLAAVRQLEELFPGMRVGELVVRGKGDITRTLENHWPVQYGSLEGAMRMLSLRFTTWRTHFNPSSRRVVELV